MKSTNPARVYDLRAHDTAKAEMGQSPGVKHSKPNKWAITGLVTLAVIVVKSPLRKLIVSVLILAMLAATQAADAGPFLDFFRVLRHSNTHPKQKPRSHRSSGKQNEDAVSSDALSHASSGGAVIGPPNAHNTRTTNAASTTKEGKNGLLYGNPVPGKQGFVISPFEPDSGYIDVRDFPSGTAVKDPYTGKIFLTP
jgi:hypothetical protein